jgi:hypothetical protein
VIIFVHPFHKGGQKELTITKFKNNNKEQSIILEIVADHLLWIWYAFFGILGSNNNINVLGTSLFINYMFWGPNNECPFIVNGKMYSCYYLLLDRINSLWSCFVQIILHHKVQKNITAKYKSLFGRLSNVALECFKENLLL